MKKHSKITIVLVVVIAIATGGGFYAHWALNRPLPNLKPEKVVTQLSIVSNTPSISWPTTGESAAGILGTNYIETSSQTKVLPIASVAKLITALTVLKDHPLSVGQQGPELTMTASDVNFYDSYVALGGSVVPVSDGEQISEYQVLEAMLLPSANNLADSLATWAYGSLSAYSTAANNYVSQLGLASTHVGSDASGFSPTTTSTPADLVKLGEIAMGNPVIAQIVGQTIASNIPIIGQVKNVNFLVGTNNVIGIKTGNTNQAGGVFLSASNYSVNDKSILIITALLNAPTLFDAVSDSLPLIASVKANFSQTPVISTGAIVGYYKLPWGGKVAAIASQNIAVNTVDGSTVTANITLNNIAINSKSGQLVGTIFVPESALYYPQSSEVTLDGSIPSPPTWWRLIHPLHL